MIQKKSFMPRRVPTENTICSDYLAQKLYELQKKTDSLPECTVCMDTISPCCHVVLLCGHQFHCRCIYSLEKCPNCRR